jgi:hypothetical protein
MKRIKAPSRTSRILKEVMPDMVMGRFKQRYGDHSRGQHRNSFAGKIPPLQAIFRQGAISRSLGCQTLLVLYHIIQKRKADDLFETDMHELSIVSDAVFLGIMNVLFIHGGAFPAIVNIRVFEDDKMVAHIFKFTNVYEVGGRIQHHIPISVSEHFPGTLQILPSNTHICLSGGRFAFACHTGSSVHPSFSMAKTTVPPPV